jgi:hypothetical protein
VSIARGEVHTIDAVMNIPAPSTSGAAGATVGDDAGAEEASSERGPMNTETKR